MTRQEEQDEAAGGPGMRSLILEDGTVVSVSIAVFKAKIGYQSYAYLRFKSAGQNTKKYVGKVTAQTRAESLQLGWGLVRKKKVVEAFGWRWERVRRDRGIAQSAV